MEIRPGCWRREWKNKLGYKAEGLRALTAVTLGPAGFYGMFKTCMFTLQPGKR